MDHGRGGRGLREVGRRVRNSLHICGDVNIGSTTSMGPFLDLSPALSERETAAICILPVPYDATTSYRPGARFGPAALLAASHQVELFDEQLERETCRVGIHTCPALPPNAAGPEAMIADVRGACTRLIDQGKFVAVVGGEHSVALGAIDALRQQRAGQPFGVVQFDAHRDLRREYESSRWSHACVAARIVEWQVPLVQLGVRAFSGEERQQAQRASVQARTARDLLQEAGTDSLDAALAGLPPDVYVTFDVDVLDPSIMPSTGTPEPGGLGWYRTLELLERVAQQRNVIGLDLVELAPIAGLVAPDLLAARLLYRILGFIARDWPLLKAAD